MKSASVTQVKDRQHAEERDIKGNPTITIYRQITSNTDDALRQAIEKILTVK